MFCRGKATDERGLWEVGNPWWEDCRAEWEDWSTGRELWEDCSPGRELWEDWSSAWEDMLTMTGGAEMVGGGFIQSGPASLSGLESWLSLSMLCS